MTPCVFCGSEGEHAEWCPYFMPDESTVEDWAGQFRSFDGLDNRRQVYELFVRMGKGLPEDLAAARRAGFLSGLLQLSANGFSGLPSRIESCSAGDAYRLFVAITGVLGVPIEKAAILLEEAVRRL